MAHPYLTFTRNDEQHCRDRLPTVMSRLLRSHSRVCYTTLQEVRQLDRYNSLVRGPWRALFDNDRRPIFELTAEFLASFQLEPRTSDVSKDDTIQFRIGGEWQFMSIEEFGRDSGIYGNDEYWATQPFTFPDEDRHGNSHIKNAFWEQIGTGEYNPSRTKSTALKDPLHRYIHRLLSHTVNQRGQSDGVISRRDLICLYSIINDHPINIGYFFCKLFDSNAKANLSTPLLGGGWINQIAENFGVVLDGEWGPPPGLVNLELLDSMGLITRIQGQGPRLIDSAGQTWDPEDPAHVFMELEGPNEDEAPRHDQPGPSSSRHYQHQSQFPSMQDLMDAIHSSTSYSRQAYEQAQANNIELRGWSGRVENIESSVAYMRRRMDRHWGPDDDDQGNQQG